ncbi:FAD-dependent monooxygenase [Pseudonocardia cypriaca]|uniref:2-polyprenyl-6-methoxyphenol hydroxylase-like FAD-dependent oxidoreductase n=1 Tax=Pseudonocardia cypriaca TaxID=882449 RepID=A0A543FT81_9PSEU|nr:FAD-dependent monooxygenase [Pseudonocardia cypriaca]TQM37031.1 2-polyprenyl-6-methoxyphenol hydroxylase-like FAD-dependent oxidoreductase [Pseudonocardia cypriaca]
MPAPSHHSVIVVGAGPVGLTLAAELGTRGVDTLVLEQNRGTTDNPRCNTTNARSMEYFRRLGVADAIRRAGLPLDHATDVVYCTTLTSWELTRFRFSSAQQILDGSAPELAEWPTPEPQHRISQIFLEPILEEHVRGYRSVAIARGHRVVGVVERGETVEVRVEADGVETVLTADYFVGCDGGASTTRRAIGARLEGDSRAAENRLSIYFRSAELAREFAAAERPGWMYWWYGPHLKGSFVQLDGAGLYLCHARVPEGVAPEDLDEDEVLRAALGREMELEKIQVVRWTPRRLVADRFRDGRILLAGDAAHLWLPLGGFGMNTGIADAVGLGWRLAALLAGWGGPELLTAYEVERRSVGEATSRAALKIDRDMATIARDPALHGDDAEGARLRAEVGALIAEIDRQQWHSQGVQFGSRYAGSPGIVADPASGRGAIDRIDRYEPTVTAGSRFPHVWLPDGRSVFDLLGRDFTLVRAHGDVDPFVDAAARLGVPLTVLDLDGTSLPGEPSRLVLVRPDMYVGWSGDTAPSDVDGLFRALAGTRQAGPRISSAAS